MSKEIKLTKYVVLLIGLSLSLGLFSIPTLARERTVISVKTETEYETIGLEFEYETNYKLSISGGVGLTITEAGSKGSIDLGLRYYLQEGDKRFYLRITGITRFDYDNTINFRAGLGVGYATDFDNKRASTEIGFLIGSENGILVVKPSVGILIGITSK